MTGRPPSNGCLACKKRRKKCDLTRPACSRCEKLQSECRYAPRTWRFIETGKDTDNAMVLDVASKPIPEAVILSIPNDAAIFFTTGLNTQISSLFWEQYLPAHLDGNTPDLAAIPFFLGYRQLAIKDSILQNALSAVALLCVSQQRNDKSLLYRGSCLYVKTIGDLNHALRRPSQATSDGILASCRTIAFYEMFRPAHQNSTQRDDWIKHVWGLASLVRLRQRAVCIDAASELHKDARALAGQCAVRTRSPAILNSIAESQISDVTLQDSVTDCIGIMTTWLEQHDSFLDNLAGKGDEQISELFQHGLRVLEALQDWESLALAICGAEVRSASVAVRCSTLLHAARSAGHRVWFVIMQYWLTCLIATSQLRFTSNYIRLMGRRVPDLPSSVDPGPYARGMADSTSDLFASDAGLWTVEQILLPVSSAVCYYAAIDAGSSWEAATLQRAFNSRKNAVFARGFLRDVKNYEEEEDEEQQQQSMKLKGAAARAWYHLPVSLAEIWRV